MGSGHDVHSFLSRPIRDQLLLLPLIMRRKGKASKGKKTEKKWDMGDLNNRDEELFKHLPNPDEIAEVSKAKQESNKKRGKE